MEGVGGVDADHAGPRVRLENLNTRQVMSPEFEQAISGYEPFWICPEFQQGYEPFWICLSWGS